MGILGKDYIFFFKNVHLKLKPFQEAQAVLTEPELQNLESPKVAQVRHSNDLDLSFTHGLRETELFPLPRNTSKPIILWVSLCWFSLLKILKEIYHLVERKTYGESGKERSSLT